MKLQYLIIFLLVVTVAQATPDKAKACTYCHDKFNVDVYRGDSEDECGYCHVVKADPRSHELNACPICHKVKDKESYHITHINITCITCHIDQKKPEGIVVTQCVACHPKPIHEIHNQCTDCHGSSVTATAASKIDYSRFTLLSIITSIFNGVFK